MALLVPLEIVAMLLYVVAIRDGPLSHTLPYLAFTPVFVHRDRLAGPRRARLAAGLGGILLVVAGAWVLNLAGPRRARPGQLGRALPRPRRRARRARRMLATAAIYSLTSVMGKAVLGVCDPPRASAPSTSS